MQKSGDTDFSSSRPFSPNIQKTSAVCQAMIWNRISASISRFLCVCSYLPIYLVVVQLLSHVWLFATPWASLFFTISWSLPKLASTELVMLSKHFILVSPFSSCPTSFPASRSFLMSWLFTSGGKVSEFQLHISSNEYSGLISFWIDWFVLLAAQESLKRLLQHHQKHHFFHAQPSLWSNPSYPFITTGKTIALII